MSRNSPSALTAYGRAVQADVTMRSPLAAEVAAMAARLSRQSAYAAAVRAELGLPSRGAALPLDRHCPQR